MRFNFQCWALVDIRFPDEEDSCLSKIRGFWPNRDAAELGLACIEADRYADHAAKEKDHRRKFPWMASLPYAPATYSFVPLSQMEFETLSDAEDMIIKAAWLIHKGCGVPA